MQCDPILYILVRTDIDSLNPGKCAAQVAHAANACQSEINAAWRSAVINDMFTEWQLSTYQWFGTTIVLDGGSLEEIRNIIESLPSSETVNSGIVLDPTYPLRDGNTTHLIPLETCAWVFGDKNNKKIRKHIDKLKLLA